jgi:Flp pilus assembly protein TadG
MKAPKTKRPEARRSERGQSLVELAISLVFLITLIAGVVDLGVAFINYVAMRDAAQEAAIYGSLHPSECTIIEQVAQESASTFLDDVTVDVRVGGAACSGSAYACAGNTIRVTVSQVYPITVPFIGSILTVPGNQLNLRATIRDTILSPYSASCPTPTTPYP